MLAPLGLLLGEGPLGASLQPRPARSCYRFPSVFSRMEITPWVPTLGLTVFGGHVEVRECSPSDTDTDSGHARACTHTHTHTQSQQHSWRIYQASRRWLRQTHTLCLGFLPHTQTEAPPTPS